MAWVVRLYKKKEIDRAGETLAKHPSGSPEREMIIPIIDNWRSCHAYPLQVIKMCLKGRAERIDKNALVSQRLKRLPSIILKLQQNDNMKLSQMHDIGGCRAVVKNTFAIQDIVKLYLAADIKSPNSGHVFSKLFDYIAQPKEDGYRGIHLVYKYRSESIDKTVYSGQRIEIQIRSKLQHAWATAVETAQLFTGQALKSRLKNASDSWLRFFALMGSAIASREKCPIVPGTPEKSEDRIAELRDIVNKEKILESLAAWNRIILVRDRVGNKESKYFLLRLDIKEQRLQVLPYTQGELQQAQDLYSEYEKEYEGDDAVQVVLVSVDSIDALRKAYPNYDIDTTEFIKAVKYEIDLPNKKRLF